MEGTSGGQEVEGGIKTIKESYMVSERVKGHSKFYSLHLKHVEVREVESYRTIKIRQAGKGNEYGDYYYLQEGNAPSWTRDKGKKK